MFIRHFYTALLLASLASRAFSADTNDQLAFFESKIRPVLAQNCFECHSAQAQQNKKLKAGLLLDSKAGVLHGGETGPALVAGKPAESLLMKVLRHEIKGAEMPPKGALPAGVIADFAKWIEMGAADPRSGAAPVVEHKRVIDVKSGQGWWAFRPLAAPALPKVKNNAWIQTPVDAFILAQQEAKGLSPNSLAAKEQLLRRATFDLTGLAPTAEEQAAFLQDSSADAYERLVDRLLASKHYGERWGRHWLDVVRFAESNGYEFDAFRAGAYHYRDWVIDALNADMPYDQFIRMQLAGDKLMPGELDGARAVGFLVAGPYPGQITAKTREKIRYDQIDDLHHRQRHVGRLDGLRALPRSQVRSAAAKGLLWHRRRAGDDGSLAGEDRSQTCRDAKASRASQCGRRAAFGRFEAIRDPRAAQAARRVEAR
jgi:hypothetical protein